MKKFLIALAIFIFAHTAHAADFSQDLFNRVNAERAKNNLPALVWNQTLAQAAQNKANDLLSKGYFEHESPEGKQFYQWIDETGYQYAMAGENLALDQYAISLDTIISSWLNSPGHRANLLSDKFVESGMAVVQGTYKGTPALIAVEEFAIPRTLPRIQPLSVNTMPVKITTEIRKVEKPKQSPPKTQIAGAVTATIPAPVVGTTRWQKIIELIRALFR